MTRESDDAPAGALVPPSPFRVLMVCTFNHCRSPLAEYLLREAIEARRLNWEVGSAGIRARDGVAAHPYVTEILTERGLDTSGWRSRSITTERVARTDLILTAEAKQRSVIVQRFPDVLHRTFPLLPFCAWLEAAETGLNPVGRRTGNALILRALEGRGRSQPLSGTEQDLPDPMGQSMQQFRQCAQRIQDAVEMLLRSR